jgi:L-lactate dehydrogenase complex protein LldG
MTDSLSKFLHKISKILDQKRQRNSLMPLFNAPEQNMFAVEIKDEVSFFANELTKVSGEVFICQNLAEVSANLRLICEQSGWKSVFCLDKNLQQILKVAEIPCDSSEDKFLDMEAGFTSCEFGVARTGSLLVSSAMVSGRRMNVYPPHHLVLLNRNQLLPELKDAYKAIAEKFRDNMPSMITLVTGPSRTADIEKTLVIGAHGPKRLIVFLCLETDS